MAHAWFEDHEQFFYNRVCGETLEQTSEYQLQETMLKSDKIWCTSVVGNCVRLQPFWMIS